MSENSFKQESQPKKFKLDADTILLNAIRIWLVIMCVLSFVFLTHAQSQSEVSFEIEECGLNTNVIRSGATELIAEDPTASYQWLDCDDDFNPIPGETHRIFSAPDYGNYAVLVSKGTCSEVSKNYPITVESVAAAEANKVEVYPNPSQGLVTVEMPDSEKVSMVSILTPQGQVLKNILVQGSPNVRIELPEQTGVYLLRFVGGGPERIVRVVRL